MTELSKAIIKVLKDVRYGSVFSYKEIAEISGYPSAARQVSRLLHTCSNKYQLPWWRIVNSNYKVVIRDIESFNQQVEVLRTEGHNVQDNGQIIFKWKHNYSFIMISYYRGGISNG